MKPIYKLLDWIDINKLDYCGLSYNEHDKAIELLEQQQNKIDWEKLSLNENNKAIKLLKQNQDKIDWKNLCFNENNKAIELLKQNQNKICWDLLLFNSNDKAIQLLKENQNKINWNWLSENPSIFELDYKQMVNKFKPIAEEIILKVYNPDRIKRLSLIYDFKFEDWFINN
jgi:hypothetical protein